MHCSFDYKKFITKDISQLKDVGHNWQGDTYISSKGCGTSLTERYGTYIEGRGAIIGMAMLIFQFSTDVQQIWILNSFSFHKRIWGGKCCSGKIVSLVYGL
jgi:hypothetical protein